MLIQTAKMDFTWLHILCEKQRNKEVTSVKVPIPLAAVGFLNENDSFNFCQRSVTHAEPEKDATCQKLEFR